jgi:hypothetical protein
LWYALIAIVVVTAVYLLAYSQAGTFPKASGLVGHLIGVAGFALMLMTETLYSIRKRLTDARWGSIAAWLRFHIVTGLVGPYMVLLHTAMRFNGLAGVAMLLTVVVVISGGVGRYVFTTLPRFIDGAGPGTGPELDEMASRLERQRRGLATWYAVHVPLTWVLFAVAFVHAGAAMLYATLQR